MEAAQEHTSTVLKELLEQLDIPPGVAQKWISQMVTRYTEPQRHYHTLQHISCMLQSFHNHKTQIENHIAVQLAIIFHDWIYEPFSKSNEIDSITAFETFASETSLIKSTTQKVTNMIHATISHSIPSSLPVDEINDMQLFLDFDLDILAQDWGVYLEYTRRIRGEYYQVPNFSAGRSAVLKKFLEKEFIYLSRTFREEKEIKARDNIAKEIKFLST